MALPFWEQHAPCFDDNNYSEKVLARTQLVCPPGTLDNCALSLDSGKYMRDGGEECPTTTCRDIAYRDLVENSTDVCKHYAPSLYCIVSKIAPLWDRYRDEFGSLRDFALSREDSATFIKECLALQPANATAITSTANSECVEAFMAFRESLDADMSAKIQSLEPVVLAYCIMPVAERTIERLQADSDAYAKRFKGMWDVDDAGAEAGAGTNT